MGVSRHDMQLDTSLMHAGLRWDAVSATKLKSAHPRVTQWRKAAYLGALEGAFLDEVLICPGFRELGSLPALIHGQQRHVVALRLEELRLLLVSLGLLLARAVEDVLCAQHADDLRITIIKVLASAIMHNSTLTNMSGS